MVKQIAEILKQIFGLNHDVQEGKAIDKKHSDEIKTLQDDLRRLAATVERYHYEQQLNRQQTAADLKNALLQIEVMLLKSERLLLPAPKSEKDKLDDEE